MGGKENETAIGFESESGWGMIYQKGLRVAVVTETKTRLKVEYGMLQEKVVPEIVKRNGRFISSKRVCTLMNVPQWIVRLDCGTIIDSFDDEKLIMEPMTAYKKVQKARVVGKEIIE